jgi:hypothetical protein
MPATTSISAEDRFNSAVAAVGAPNSFTCNGATPVTIVDPNVTAKSAIIITLQTPGGTVGATHPMVKTITPGVGFTAAGVASDTSVYNYTRIG